MSLSFSIRANRTRWRSGRYVTSLRYWELDDKCLQRTEKEQCANCTTVMGRIAAILSMVFLRYHHLIKRRCNQTPTKFAYILYVLDVRAVITRQHHPWSHSGIHKQISAQVRTVLAVERRQKIGSLGSARCRGSNFAPREFSRCRTLPADYLHTCVGRLGIDHALLTLRSLSLQI